MLQYYAKAAAPVPITNGYKFYHPSSAGYTAASNTVPRFSYAHYAYPQIAAYSPYTGQQANIAAAYSSYYPAYFAGAGGYYTGAGYQSALSGQPAVGYLQAASVPQQVQVAAGSPLTVYSTAGPKVSEDDTKGEKVGSGRLIRTGFDFIEQVSAGYGYGANIYTASDAGHIFHQPHYGELILILLIYPWHILSSS